MAAASPRKLKNPQTLLSLGVGVGSSQLLLAICRWAGWDISPEWATSITAACTSGVFYVWDKGLLNLIHHFLYGPPVDS